MWQLFLLAQWNQSIPMNEVEAATEDLLWSVRDKCLLVGEKRGQPYEKGFHSQEIVLVHCWTRTPHCYY